MYKWSRAEGECYNWLLSHHLQINNDTMRTPPAVVKELEKDNYWLIFNQNFRSFQKYLSSSKTLLKFIAFFFPPYLFFYILFHTFIFCPGEVYFYVRSHRTRLICDSFVIKQRYRDRASAGLWESEIENYTEREREREREKGERERRQALELFPVCYLSLSRRLNANTDARKVKNKLRNYWDHVTIYEPFTWHVCVHGRTT